TALQNATAGCEGLELEIDNRERERTRVREVLAGFDRELGAGRARLERLYQQRDGCLAGLASGRQRIGFLEARAEALAAEAARAAGEIVRLSSETDRDEAHGGFDEPEAAANLLRLEGDVEKLTADLRDRRRLVDDLRREQASVAGQRERLRRGLDQNRERQIAAREAHAQAAARRSALELTLSATEREIPEL